jgi:flagellar basal-body rod protein FlgG
MVIIIALLPFFAFSQENIPLDEEYLILFSDLENANTNGYKSHFLDIDFDNNIFERKVTRQINFAQGSLTATDRQLDFAIIGEGFFKIILDGRIFYTRNGEFTIKNDTNELVTIDGYKLYDQIIIPPGFIKLSITENHEIITEYSDGQKVNNGFLNIYILDNSKLEYYQKYYVERKNIFLYTGTEEKISYDRIYNKIIECSNVDVSITIFRITRISKLINFDCLFKEQESLFLKLFFR